jgi:DNA-binding transcriptional regulator YiaG
MAESTSDAKKSNRPKKGTAEYFKKRESLTSLSRLQVARRIGCSPMTVIRWEKAGRLKPYRYAHNLVRYRIEDVVALEQEAGV